MLDAIPNAAWMRNTAGKLAWVNAAYARAVETRDPKRRSPRTELLDRPAPKRGCKDASKGAIWRARVAAVVAGERQCSMGRRSRDRRLGGLATDISEIEAVRADLGRQMESHARTLDQLSTAVAMFDRTRRLVFYNAACRQLWSLDAALLDQRRPTGKS